MQPADQDHGDTVERIYLHIFGRVQGVGYRWHTGNKAGELDLKGWVRNCPDGSVRAVAEGPRDQLQVLADWTERGPGPALVDRVEVIWGEATEEFDKFKITG
jgi:acylphosphatase